jgi:hypothetical protein
VTSFYWLTLGILGVWRVTHLLAAENGPWDIVSRVRLKLGDGVLGRLFDCFYCLSLWVAAPFAWALGAGLKESMLLWLAMSGAAILLERATKRRDIHELRELLAPLEPLEPHYWEDDSDGMLRKDSSRVEPASSVDH